MSETTEAPVSTTEATDAQKPQAEQVIENGPSIIEDAPTAPEPGPYDDEAEFPYRKLQALAKDRDLDASGKREEIIARLVESDNADNSPGADATAGVENGGIGRNAEVSRTHADSLQSLSDARRKAQLAAVEG